MARVSTSAPLRTLMVLPSSVTLPLFLPASPWLRTRADAVSSRLCPPDTETLAPLPSAISAASSPEITAESRPTMRTAPSARCAACPTDKPAVLTVPLNTASAMSLPPSTRAPWATTAAAPKIFTEPTALILPLISTLPRSEPGRSVSTPASLYWPFFKSSTNWLAPSGVTTPTAEDSCCICCAEGVVMVKLPTLMTPLLPTTMPWGSANMMLPPIRLPSVSTPLSVPLITTRESCTRLTRLLAPLGT